MNTRLRLFTMMTVLAVGSGVLMAADDTPASPSSDLGMIAPPAADSRNTAAPTSSALAPVRPNVSLTTNALLGFVNSEPVFAQDLFRPIDSNLRSFATNARDISEFRAEARSAIERQMHSYVSDVLVISAARANLSDNEKHGLEIYLAKQRSDLLSKYGGSQALADLALKATGSSVEKEIANDRREMAVRIYLHRELVPKIVVTRQMVMDEYERSKHSEDAEIELYMITLRVSRWLRDPGTDGKLGPVMQNPTDAQIHQAEQMALKQAADIIDQLRKGEDFSRLVEDYSQDARANYGGRIPNVKRGFLRNQSLEDAAFALPANTLGEPLLVKDPDFRKEAVVILKVGQKKEARTIPFSEAQKEIFVQLNNKQYKQLSDEYMNKLSEGAAIEAVERMTDVALDVAVARYATQ